MEAVVASVADAVASVAVLASVAGARVVAIAFSGGGGRVGAFPSFSDDFIVALASVTDTNGGGGGGNVVL